MPAALPSAMRCHVCVTLVAMASAQFGTIQIDWTGREDGSQEPVVVGVEHDARHQHSEREAMPRQRGAAMRERLLLAERALVASLADGDRAVPALWAHWFGEEGEVARESIQDANEVLDDPAGAGEASSLLQLIDEFPEWAEPINRLATLRYLQGRFDESVALCERVLALKPWHFGALSGIIMCHTELRAFDEAKRWSELAMPPIQSTAQRAQWVQRALAAIDSRLAK